MQSSSYLTNNQRVTANIKIRSLEGETAFLLLALTSLVHAALSSVIMWQAIFNICPNISCIFLWSGKQFRAACLHTAFPSPPRSGGAAFPFPPQFGHQLAAAGARSRACCSGTSRTGHGHVPPAHGHAGNHHPEPHVRVNVKSGSRYQPAWRFSRSFPCRHVGERRSGNSQLLSALEVRALRL